MLFSKKTKELQNSQAAVDNAARELSAIEARYEVAKQSLAQKTAQAKGNVKMGCLAKRIYNIWAIEYEKMIQKECGDKRLPEQLAEIDEALKKAREYVLECSRHNQTLS